MALNYNAPIDGQQSSIDGAGSVQMNNFYWIKKAMIDAKKIQVFMPLATAVDLPKHFGKHIKLYHYLPLLDDRNVNDQGIDASGAVIANGNLYGSSKDIGTIVDKIPVLSEEGGRVNRVGFTRIQIEGTIHKVGMFYEFTQESLDFDSDSQLREHLSRELITGATQQTEDYLQIDLLNSAGTVVFPGGATKNSEVTGEEVGGVDATVVTYDSLQRLDAILTENLTDRHTKIITGSTKIDTRVVPACRVIYVGPELKPILRRLTDHFGNKAFIEVQHYADAANVLTGEIGSVDSFRFIEVANMFNWSGEGAEVTTNPGYRTATKDGKERYNIYPMLVVGNESFSTIGFQTGGESVKFNIITKMPGRETAGYRDPYGQLGFSSIWWNYGILVKRPERIGLIKTVAPI